MCLILLYAHLTLNCCCSILRQFSPHQAPPLLLYFLVMITFRGDQVRQSRVLHCPIRRCITATNLNRVFHIVLYLSQYISKIVLG